MSTEQDWERAKQEHYDLQNPEPEDDDEVAEPVKVVPLGSVLMSAEFLKDFVKLTLENRVKHNIPITQLDIDNIYKDIDRIAATLKKCSYGPNDLFQPLENL